MKTRRTSGLIALALVVMLLLACDLANVSGLAPTSSPGVSKPAPTSSSPGTVKTSEAVPDYLKCDPQKLLFPLPPDAQNCQHLDILTTFRTNLSPEQAMQFYRDNLAKSGWKRKDDGALPGIGYWVKESKQLNVITAVEKGMTSVQIQEITAK